MNILWDLRLYSYGYANRGVGVYVRAVAGALSRLSEEVQIVGWGDRDKIPSEIAAQVNRWISYRRGGWRSSIFVLPLLAIMHRIELIHHWIGMGPIWHIGMTPVKWCKTVVTVFDTGVDEWELPHSKAVRHTLYWKMQKRIMRNVDGIMAISHDAGKKIQLSTRNTSAKIAVIYPPLVKEMLLAKTVKLRQPFLITLGGGPHKNTRRVIDAFVNVRQTLPGVTMIILGEIDTGDIDPVLPAGVMHERAMSRYAEYLSECSGLVFCSLFEGLGLPPIEAMQFGCPVLASHLPSLLEICSDAACFADPLLQKSIEEGMVSLVKENSLWQEKSIAGARKYLDICGDADEKCRRFYRKVTDDKRGGFR